MFRIIEWETKKFYINFGQIFNCINFIHLKQEIGSYIDENIKALQLALINLESEKRKNRNRYLN